MSAPKSNRSISIEDAEGIIDGPRVAVQKISQHRWYTKELIVFHDDDHLLAGLIYLRPATEIQEDQDRFESDPVAVFPVTAKQVMTTVYEIGES